MSQNGTDDNDIYEYYLLQPITLYYLSTIYIGADWIKVRSDVYDAVKARRDAELSGKVPVDIDVTLPDGMILVEDKVRGYFIAFFAFANWIGKQSKAGR